MGKVILTGLQPTGNLHIGNYLGAIKPLINLQKDLQKDDKAYIFVPDLHIFTIKTDFDKVFERIISNVKCYLASGIDPEKFVIFRQSRVSAHSELMWILSCFSYFGELSRMTQFKDKSQSEESKSNPITSALFSYPVLMAADILLYEAKYIPVGDDQRQHLELARDIAIRMNNIFKNNPKLDSKDLFEVPLDWKNLLEFTKTVEGLRIRSLQDPTKKMSKSITDPKGTISLNDDAQTARKKIMSAVTDDLATVNWDWENQPGITNLLQIFASFQGLNHQEILEKTKGFTSYGELKKEIGDTVFEFLTDFQEKYNNISDQTVLKILEKGELIANKKSQETLLRVQKVLGLR